MKKLIMLGLLIIFLIMPNVVAPAKWVKCDRCDGFGVIEETFIEYGIPVERIVTCPKCDGRGEVAEWIDNGEGKYGGYYTVIPLEYIIISIIAIILIIVVVIPQIKYWRDKKRK